MGFCPACVRYEQVCLHVLDFNGWGGSCSCFQEIQEQSSWMESLKTTLLLPKMGDLLITQLWRIREGLFDLSLLSTRIRVVENSGAWAVYEIRQVEEMRKTLQQLKSAVKNLDLQVSPSNIASESPTAVPTWVLNLMTDLLMALVRAFHKTVH